MNIIFKLVSSLLNYPTKSLIEALPELKDAVATVPMLKRYKTYFVPVLHYLTQQQLLALQMDYVQSFDFNKSHSLYLFEHLHGEDRDRGMAMVDLSQAYQTHGFKINDNSELPDYLPLLLEFLSQTDEATALEMLSEAIHVIAHIRDKMVANGLVYASLLDLLVVMSPVVPHPLVEVPVRDMDEAMELFGVDFDGMEPLTQPNFSSCINCPR